MKKIGLPSVDEVVQQTRPQLSLSCVRPHVLTANASWFLANFSGKILYSVKSNPDPVVLQALYDAGLRHFDVASLYEVDMIHRLFPAATKYFMHTVKSREAIRKSYHDYGVRHYSLDSVQELQKIRQEIGQVDDLNLCVRIAIKNMYSELDLSGKFGAAVEDAIKLLKHTRKTANKLGVSFHVGSQCMDPLAYRNAIGVVKTLIEQSDVKLDFVDVGGGFPGVYPDLAPPSLDRYMDEIHSSFKTLPGHESMELWCEPGRAMVVESGSIVVRVELRKGDMLYINDGVYGSLFDAGTPRFVYPTRLIRPCGSDVSRNTAQFSFYGPTCDSIDVMKGPFVLPDDVEEGDYIEIGQLGAYGRTMQTNFNGFGSNLQALVSDAPLMSIFAPSEEEETKQDAVGVAVA